MVDPTDLGYDPFLERRIHDVDPANVGSSVASASSLANQPMTSGEIAGALPEGSVPFSATGMAQFVDNEDMQTKSFVSGVAGSGWRIKGNGDVEFNSGTFMGSLTAATIDIGGSDASSFHVDIDGNMWLGAATFNITTNPFAVSNAGAIRAVSGNIAGWNLADGYIYNLQSGTPAASPSDGIVMASGNEGVIVYENTEKRVEMGYLSAGVYGIKGYADNGTTVIFEMSDTQQKVAGWYFTDAVLRSNTTDATSAIFIDSANTLIRAGVTTGDYLTLDGANLRLRSSNYVSGFAGAGFTLEPDLLEVGNIACRGLFRTYVLQKDILSVNAGSLVVAPNADVLDTDMTAADASTLTIKATATFSVGDLLRIKDSSDDEWLEVTNVAGAPTYVVTRDSAGAYGADANPAWKKGASVVNYGASGDGGLYLTASDTNNPYLSVFTHAGAPWTTLTTQVRVGNLNGYLGYAADTFGFGAGSSTGTESNITVDTTNGVRVRSGTTNKFVVDTSGNVTVGEVAASQSNVYITSGALSLRNNVTDKIVLKADGTAYFAGAITVGDGTTTSGSITLNHFATGGDTYISGGTITIADWTAQNGFIMGIDDSDSDKFKFYFGDSSTNEQLDWNVSTVNALTMNGKLVETIKDEAAVFFETITFIGSKNDGLTETPGVGTIDRDLLITQITSANSNTFLQSDTLGSMGNTIDWDADTEFYINAIELAGNAGIVYFGFSDGTIAHPIGSNLTKHIAFIIDANITYASVSDGIAQTLSAALSGVSSDVWNAYKIVYEAGVSAKFYVKAVADNDWVLKETLTTNLPSGNAQLPKMTFGARKNATVDGSMYIRNNYIAKATP